MVIVSRLQVLDNFIYLYLVVDEQAWLLVLAMQ